MPRLAGGLAAVLFASLLATADPALAGSQAHRDPPGDVTHLRAAPVDQTVDILTAVNTYRGHTLSLKFTVADLAPQGYSAVWFIKTRKDTFRLFYDHENARPRVFFGGGFEKQRRDRSCPGVTVKASGAASAVAARIPRSCLKRADVVKVSGGMVKMGSVGYIVDDSRRRGTTGQDFKYGPPMSRN